MFAKNVTFSAFDLVGLSRDRPKELDDTFAEVMDLIRSGELMPVKPVTTFDMLKAEQAFRTMQMGRHIGELVLVPKKYEVVKIILSTSSREKYSTRRVYKLVLRPRVKGTQNLHVAVKCHTLSPPDFFILLLSISAIVGILVYGRIRARTQSPRPSSH